MRHCVRYGGDGEVATATYPRVYREWSESRIGSRPTAGDVVDN